MKSRVWTSTEVEGWKSNGHNKGAFEVGNSRAEAYCAIFDPLILEFYMDGMGYDTSFLLTT
jgi:hypothetical protein